MTDEKKITKGLDKELMQLNDKHLSIEVEYDIINEKSTSKVWRTTTNNTFQHRRSVGSIFNVT